MTNLLTILLTPSFHPARGITPMTQIVVQQIDSVAKNPIMMFIVAMVRIGNASDTPMAIPRIALSAKD